MNGWWIVFDRKTGAFDGAYRRKEMAQGALESLTRRIPHADWVLQQWKTGMPRLNDHDFWINIYKKEYFNE
mgnify:CR=1 FL=1